MNALSRGRGCARRLSLAAGTGGAEGITPGGGLALSELRLAAG